jgi:hypothetical protein
MRIYHGLLTHLKKYKKHECGTHIIESFLYGKQIPKELYNVVESSITDDIIGMDSDVLISAY